MNFETRDETRNRHEKREAQNCREIEKFSRRDETSSNTIGQSVNQETRYVLKLDLLRYLITYSLCANEQVTENQYFLG